MTHLRPRLLTAASTALLLALSLSACSGDSGDTADDPDPTSAATTSTTDEPTDAGSDSTSATVTAEPADPAAVPAVDELDAALLTSADVPEGFVEEPDDEDDSDTFDGTCLGDVGKFDEAFGAAPDAEAKVQFVQSGSDTQAFVGSALNAYADVEKLQTEFGDFISRLQDCTSVEATDADGVEIALDIAYDDSVTVPDADQQLRIEMTGTIGLEANSYDIAYSFLVSVTQGIVSLIGAYELGTVDTGLRDGVDGWAELQAGRVGELLG